MTLRRKIFGHDREKIGEQDVDVGDGIRRDSLYKCSRPGCDVNGVDWRMRERGYVRDKPGIVLRALSETAWQKKVREHGIVV